MKKNYGNFMQAKSFKQQLEDILVEHNEELSPQLNDALVNVGAELDERRKVFDAFIDEVADYKTNNTNLETKNSMLAERVEEQEEEIDLLKDKITLQECGIKEFEDVLVASNEQIRGYLAACEDREEILAELEHTKDVYRKATNQLTAKKTAIETYKDACNRLLAYNKELSRQLLEYEQNINQGFCTRFMGISLSRSYKTSA